MCVFFCLPLLLIPFNHTRKIIFFWTNGMHRDITNALNFKWCKCVSNYIWCESCQLDSFLKTDLRYSKLIRSTRNIKVHKRRHTIPFVKFSLLAPIQYKNMSFLSGFFFCSLCKRKPELQTKTRTYLYEEILRNGIWSIFLQTTRLEPCSSFITCVCSLL